MLLFHRHPVVLLVPGLHKLPAEKANTWARALLAELQPARVLLLGAVQVRRRCLALLRHGAPRRAPGLQTLRTLLLPRRSQAIDQPSVVTESAASHHQRAPP